MVVSAFGDGGEDSRFEADRHNRGSASDLVQVTLVRLEAKFDALAQTQSLRHEALTSDIKHIRETQLVTSSDHELRIRTLEQRSIDPARVFTLEQRRYVEPKTVWTAVGTLTALGLLTMSIISLSIR